MAEAKHKFYLAKMEHDLFFLAHQCHSPLYDQMHKTSTTDKVTLSIALSHIFYETAKKVLAGGKDREAFNTYLGKYLCLKFTSIGVYSGELYLSFQMK